MLRTAMQSIGRRSLSAAALASGLAAGAAVACSTDSAASERRADKLPTFSKEEVAALKREAEEEDM